jgi:flagellar hook-associated protein 1
MLGTLGVSQSGLNAAKVAVENVSNNIANENTPGYKKRVVQLSEIEQMDTRFSGRGVSASSSYRITSQYMYDKLINENSKSNYYDKLSNMLENVESVFSETEDSGFSADLNRYFQSMENLRSNPNSEVYRTTLKNQGSILVESIQNVYSGIEAQEKLEKLELYQNVDSINSILQDIGALNEKMGQYNTVSNDLLDKRDQLEFELSKYVDIDVTRTNGDYELKIAGTTAVRYNTNVRDVKIEEQYTPQIDKYTTIDDTTNTVYDSLKYKDDYSARTYTNGDVVSYKINNQYEVSVTIGDSMTMDWNGDGTATTQTVDSTNLTRALVEKINTNADVKDLVVAYNGNYSLDVDGEKVIDNSKDNFLRIESKVDGTVGDFDGRISIVSASDGKNAVYKNDYQSAESTSRVYLSIFEKEINLKSGVIKAQTDNLTSDSINNKFQIYKDKLDSFVRTLSDISDKYIQTGTDEYVFGEAATDETSGTVISLGLFSGSSVKNFTFNSNAINDLSQEELDYLSVLQMKKDISFTDFAQDSTDGEITSFSEFYQDVRVNVSSDKENIDFLMETQDNVKQSLQSSYDQLVKVDKDEEMVNLIKFQAAYTANAKIITAIDEMLQVLLGIKR